MWNYCPFLEIGSMRHVHLKPPQGYIQGNVLQQLGKIAKGIQISVPS